MSKLIGATKFIENEYIGVNVICAWLSSKNFPGTWVLAKNVHEVLVVQMFMSVKENFSDTKWSL